MSIRYSSLYARQPTRAIVGGLEVVSSTFVFNGQTPDAAGYPVVLSGTYAPAVNGIATFNADVTLTDSVVLADIPFGSRVTRVQFQQSGDMYSAAGTTNAGFGLVTPLGIVATAAGLNPAIETVFGSSLVSILSASAVLLEAATGHEAPALAILGTLATAVRPAGRGADFYQLIVSPASAAINQGTLRFIVEYVPI